MSSLRRMSLAIAVALGPITIPLAGPALAGGLYVSEFATPDMGAAGAGIIAGGTGPGGAVTNPATMTLLDSHQLHIGLAPGFSVAEFDPDSDTPVAGNDGGDQGGFIPLLSSAYVHKLSDRIRLGLGAFSISGAALDPNDSWAGRNQATDIQLFSLSLFPSLGIRLTDWLSMGGGPFITYATLDWKLRAPLPGPGNNEGGVKLDDLDDWGVAAVLGFMVQPLDNVRIGLVYQSKTKLDLDGTARLPAALGSQDVDLRLSLPQAIRSDVRWQTTDELALTFGGAWENWDDLKETRLALGDARSTIRLGFKDSYKLRGGIHYQIDEEWMVQTGLSYDSSALRSRDRTPALPVDEQWRWGIGGTYDGFENKQIGFAFQYTNLGRAKIDNAALKGEYDRNELFFFVVTLNLKKLPWDDMGTF